MSMLDPYENDVISVLPKKKKIVFLKLLSEKNDAVKLFKVHSRYNGW